eukprot:5194057-Amphidinium_carterae.1
MPDFMQHHSERLRTECPAWFRHIVAFRYLLALIATDIVVSLVDPSIIYISTTFFAQKYSTGGHIDCELTPKSHECRLGATDAAFYRGLSHACGNVGAILAALTTASLSDAVGRLPLLQVSAFIHAIPYMALMAHHFIGLNYWVYLISSPAAMAFDINGVYLAWMSDVIPQPEERAQANGILIASSIAVAGCLMPLGFLLSRTVLMVASIIALLVRQLYLLLIVPETAPAVSRYDGKSRHGVCAAWRQAGQLITRHSFLFRMSSVLLIWGLGGAGYAVVLGPFLTGFLGCERKDFLIVGGLALASMLVAYVLLLGPMVRAVGDIRVLQLSLLASVTFPLCLTAVVNLQQFLLLITFFAGPIALAYPIVSAIKSNLVHKEEQGLVQGT